MEVSLLMFLLSVDSCFKMSAKHFPVWKPFSTVCWHEDLAKFPNCLNTIPNENSGLKKKSGQYFFLYVCMKKKLFIIGWKLPRTQENLIFCPVNIVNQSLNASKSFLMWQFAYSAYIGWKYILIMLVANFPDHHLL